MIMLWSVLVVTSSYALVLDAVYPKDMCEAVATSLQVSLDKAPRAVLAKVGCIPFLVGMPNRSSNSKPSPGA